MHSRSTRPSNVPTAAAAISRPRARVFRPALLSAMAAVLATVSGGVALAALHDGESIEESKPDKIVKKDEKPKPAKVTVKAAVKPKKPAVKAEVKVDAEPAKIDEKTHAAVKVHGHAVVDEKVAVKAHVEEKVAPKAHVDGKVAAKAHVDEKVAAKVDTKHPRVDAEIESPRHAVSHVRFAAATPGAKVDEKHRVVTKVEPEAHAIAKVESAKLVEHAHPKAAAAVEPGSEIKVAKHEPKTTKDTQVLRVDGAVAEASSTKPKPKVVAARTPTTNGGRRKGAVKAEEVKPCAAPRVHVDRGGLEPETLALTDCKGKPLAAAQEKLSVLVRPWGAAKPGALAHASSSVAPKANAKGEIAPGVRLLDAGLLVRLEAIAKHFPGKSFSFVSGYRPQSKGSLHQTGRAVDVRLTGVSNEELVAFCKTLKDTGCGYYPNSSFVHVDVRNAKTGSTSWIDASGPGEAPRYVSQWPPPRRITPAGESQEELVAAPPDEEPHDDVPSEDLPRKKPLGEYPDHL